MTEQLLAGLLEVHPVSIRLRDSLPAPEKERLLEEMRALLGHVQQTAAGLTDRIRQGCLDISPAPTAVK